MAVARPQGVSVRVALRIKSARQPAAEREMHSPAKGVELMVAACCRARGYPHAGVAKRHAGPHHPARKSFVTEHRQTLLARLGFRFGINGPHAARTVMLGELRLLLGHSPLSANLQRGPVSI